MIALNDELLAELGLSNLPIEEKNRLLKHIYETLELRVGQRLAALMSAHQLSEFEAYYDAKDTVRALAWLEANFPDYPQIVQREFTALKDEVASVAPEILAAAGV